MCFHARYSGRNIPRWYKMLLQVAFGFSVVLAGIGVTLRRVVDCFSEPRGELFD